MPDAMSDFAISTVTVAPSPADSGTTMTVADGSLFPTPPFDMTLWPANANPRKPNAEIARVLSMSGNNVTSMLRSQYGSTNQNVTVGFQCEQGVTANLLSQLGGGTTTLSLTYNGQTFDVPVSSLPAGWSGSGFASMFAQLTTGPTLVSGLLDSYGTPIPDRYTFPATIFVENSDILDIVAQNAYVDQFPGQSGYSWWGPSGGSPGANIGPSALIIQNLPTTDPEIAGAFWNYNGQIVASGFTSSTFIESVVAGVNVTVDDTDPQNPIVSAIAGDGTSMTRKYTFNFDDPNLATGAPLFEPVAGDIILGITLSIPETAWDGTTPKCDLFFGGGQGFFSKVAGQPIPVDVPDDTEADFGYTVGGASSAVNAFGAYSVLFTASVDVVVSQDGTPTGGDPGSTQGQGVVYVTTVTPA